MMYFGTDLDAPGHYFWECKDNALVWSKSRNYPFNPENFPRYTSDRPNRLGDVKFYHIAQKYTLCAIYGSPADKRKDAKCVFFVDELIEPRKMWEQIGNIPICYKIIHKLNFILNISYELHVSQS